ncbi:hypothetical protein QLX08_003009 [Tetragonisca angustula]|uniref:Uncharacterized protein n=1 Tax=Tetragonisca angustula TaxID=166442 RepID=A0AAW1AB20_9HYME
MREYPQNLSEDIFLYIVHNGLHGVFNYFTGIGYWIFGPKLIELNMKQYFKKQTLIDCDKECADNTASYEGDGLTVTEQLVTETNVEIHVSRDTC